MMIEWLKRHQIGFPIIALISCVASPAWGQQPLVVDQSDNRGWVFYARPDINLPGEAPIRGISDHASGNTSLNFSTTLGNESVRNATLTQINFPAPMSDIATFNDLTSMSWWVNHSSAGKYPKIAIWANWEDSGNAKREAIYFVPESLAITANQWDLVTINLNTSQFTNNGVTTGGIKETRTFATWLQTIGDFRIESIQITYNSPADTEYESYVDYIEINGTTFDFEDAIPLELNASPSPVPLPLWLFSLLSAVIAGLGYRRLKRA
jgi:hypothetical protein